MAKCPKLLSGAHVPVGRYVGAAAGYPGVDRIEQEYYLFEPPDAQVECLRQGCQLWATWMFLQEKADGTYEEKSVTGCGQISGGRAQPHNS